MIFPKRRTSQAGGEKSGSSSSIGGVRKVPLRIMECAMARGTLKRKDRNVKGGKHNISMVFRKYHITSYL